MFTAAVGQRVTTRYYGGLEAVIVRQVHPTYYIVARMGGHAKNFDGDEATDVLPRDKIARAYDDARNVVYIAEGERDSDPHPALVHINP